MSIVGADATGGGEIMSVIRQLIEQTLSTAEITSAGGDSPKINTIRSFDIPSTDFSDLLDQAIRTAVIRHMEEGGMLEGVGVGEDKEDPAGLTASQATRLGGSAMSFLQNPESLVSAGITKLPQAVLITFAISMIPIIINDLTKPGGPFDLRFKRIMEKEFNSLMDRQSAYDYSIGERGLIIQSRAGSLNRNTGGVNANTLRILREGGIDKNKMLSLDYEDRSKGLF